jgi:UDP-glucose 4-epimerase
VYPSSASVYGAAKVMPIQEDTQCAPVSPYGVNKRIAEQLILSHGANYGTAAAIVRLFSVYGCGLRKQLLWDACRKLSSGDFVFAGTGNETRDWLHVDDAAELLLIATKYAVPHCPVMNGGTGTGIHVREMLTHLASCLDAGGEPLMFSGISRSGDPNAFVADMSQTSYWDWKPIAYWMDKVAEYVAWWQLEMRPAESYVQAVTVV